MDNDVRITPILDTYNRNKNIMNREAITRYNKFRRTRRYAKDYDLHEHYTTFDGNTRLRNRMVYRVRPRNMIPTMRPFIQLCTSVNRTRSLVRRDVQRIALTINVTRLQVFFLRLLDNMVSSTTTRIHHLLTSSAGLYAMSRTILLALPRRTLQTSPRP